MPLGPARPMTFASLLVLAYAGLWTFASLLVLAYAGLWATFVREARNRDR